MSVKNETNLEPYDYFFVEEIAEKFIKLGYEKKLYNKTFNEIDNIIDINNELGDINLAKFLNEKMMLMVNKCVPDIEFTVNGFTVGIFKNKNLIEIACDGVNKRLPFKKYKINDFHKLFIENEHNIEHLLLNSDN